MSSGQMDALGVLGAFTDIGSSTGTSTGTSITSGGTNTKGSYTQLVASATRDIDYLIIGWENGPSAGSGLALDIAVGAGGSEQNILTNLYCPDVDATSGPYFVPISIPAGTRISARIASTSASDVLRVNIVCGSGDYNYRSYSISDTYGFTAASTVGSAIDPGATANTKGAYTQMTASASRDHKAIMFALDRQGHAAAAATLLVDIAFGAAASEQVVIPNILCTAPSTGNPRPILSPVIPLAIPAGTRIAVRAQSSINTATTRIIGMTLYGFA